MRIVYVPVKSVEVSIYNSDVIKNDLKRAGVGTPTHVQLHFCMSELEEWKRSNNLLRLAHSK